MEEGSLEAERLRGRHPGDLYIRRRILHVRRLRRALGVPGLFSSAYGNVGSSIYYALGVVALYALGLTPVVFVFAGLLFACTALSYAEGTAAIPEAGGSSSFARRGFNELVSFVAGWALMLDYIITIAISAFEVPNYLAVFFPTLKTWPLNSFFGIVVVAILAVINVIGVKEATGVNIGLAVLDLATQAILVVIGMLLLFSPQILLSNIQLGVAPTWHQLLYGISISMIAYTGIETVSNLAEESRNPGRDIPRSVNLVFVAVLGMYSFISVVALSAMPVMQQPDGGWSTELGTRWLQDPVMGIVHHLPAGFSAVLGAWVGILAATILIIATNAGILGLSRLAYSMGQHKQLPPLLSQVHRRFHTPHSAIIVFALVAAILITPGSVELLADLYSFGAMLAFTFAHISIIALRVRHPDMPRPFKIPFNVSLRGKDIPLTAIVGGLGTFSTWLVVVYSHEFGRIVGFLWLIVGLLLYLSYRRALKMSIFATIQPPRRAQVRPLSHIVSNIKQE
ncbi:MAG: APC family permease [Chloroflexi bacterium]|nr:APC family permease [Chloroflexota bacterium]MCL5076490.1 APC family permease [Chloroflexota bacterium]